MRLLILALLTRNSHEVFQAGGVEGALRYGSGPDAPPVFLGRFLRGTAASQGDAEANLAEGRSLTALNGSGQNSLERAIAL